MSSQNKVVVTGIVVSLIVILLDFFAFSDVSSNLELFVVPVITLIYFLKGSIKSKRLMLFFVCYTFGDFCSIFLYNPDDNFYYYLCNIAYIVAYFFLILYLLKDLNFKIVFKKFLLDFIVLCLLNAYMLYVLMCLIMPLDFESSFVPGVQVVEFLYNLTLMLLLSFSFLNFVQNNEKIFLILFISCLLIAFSELILIGHYFIQGDLVLSYTSTIFFVFGVCFLYYHDSIKKQPKTDVLFG